MPIFADGRLFLSAEGCRFRPLPLCGEASPFHFQHRRDAGAGAWRHEQSVGSGCSSVGTVGTRVRVSGVLAHGSRQGKTAVKQTLDTARLR